MELSKIQPNVRNTNEDYENNLNYFLTNISIIKTFSSKIPKKEKIEREIEEDLFTTIYNLLSKKDKIYIEACNKIFEEYKKKDNFFINLLKANKKTNYFTQTIKYIVLKYKKKYKEDRNKYEYNDMIDYKITKNYNNLNESDDPHIKVRKLFLKVLTKLREKVKKENYYIYRFYIALKFNPERKKKYKNIHNVLKKRYNKNCKASIHRTEEAIRKIINFKELEEEL
jgi:hypothetical protein